MKSLLTLLLSCLPLLNFVRCTENNISDKPVIPEIKKVDVPVGMIYIPRGVVEMGTTNGSPNEFPVSKQVVKQFLMDKHPVTVGQFRVFVEATGYKTQAEDFGDAGIFDLDDLTWKLVDEASWEYPRGPDYPQAKNDHPVTQVSWNDANAYAEWAGKRLPTETEWEHAARNAINRRNKFSWGNNLVDNGRYRANTWQGFFPVKNTIEDGYQYTSPVGTFGETELGLQDMSGNVWEWCANWATPYGMDENQMSDHQLTQKALRGGSFLCEPNVCYGYRVSARFSNTPETSLFHMGFRCVKDINPDQQKS